MLACDVISWFQAFAFHKRNLCRYAAEELDANRPEGEEGSDEDDDEEESGEGEVDEEGKPKAVIKKISRKGKEPVVEEDDGEGAGGSSRQRVRKDKKAVPEGFEEEVVYEKKVKDSAALSELLGTAEVDEAALDPKELGRRLAEKKAVEESAAAAMVEKNQQDASDKEARKIAKKAENEAKVGLYKLNPVEPTSLKAPSDCDPTLEPMK